MRSGATRHTVSGGPSERRHSCVGRSALVQANSITPTRASLNRFTTLNCDLHNSIEFNKRLNLVRDPQTHKRNSFSSTSIGPKL